MQFVDLKAQYQLYKTEIDREIATVLERCDFIMGKSVRELESALSHYTGTAYAIGCSSGTDALLLALMALDIEPGDEVITTPYSFIATAEVISFLKAKPIFVDVEADTYNLDPSKLEAAISKNTKTIIPVSLFGEVANMATINEIALKHKLPVIEDAAQSFGATYQGKKSTNLSTIATTSFFPAKPLGGYGDSGAVFTNDDAIAKKIRMLLNHGQGERYHHDLIGINGRLDSLQAAVLKVKLTHLNEELKRRNEIAALYDQRLNKDCFLPQKRSTSNSTQSALAQYSLTIVEGKVVANAHSGVADKGSELRKKVMEQLSEKNIPTAIYYPIPFHLQTAFKYLGYQKGDFPVSEKLSETMFSIPVQPFLKDEEVEQVIDTLNQIF